MTEDPDLILARRAVAGYYYERGTDSLIGGTLDGSLDRSSNVKIALRAVRLTRQHMKIEGQEGE